VTVGATQGLVRETTQHIEQNVAPELQQQKMHELSFYYLSFLQKRSATIGPQQLPPLPPEVVAEHRRQMQAANVPLQVQGQLLQKLQVEFWQQQQQQKRF